MDLGITGEDMIEESGATVNLLMKLGFGKCRLSVQAPKGTVQDVRTLAGSGSPHPSQSSASAAASPAPAPSLPRPALRPAWPRLS